MKVINHTKWKTAHLRAIASKIASDELNPAERKKLIITFKHNDSDFCCSGWAYFHKYRCTVRVPKTPAHDTKKSDTWIFDLAAVIAHEMAHCHGHDGERWMRASVRYGHACLGQVGHGGKDRVILTRQFYDWVIEMPLEEKDPPKKKSPLSTAEAAFEKTLLALKRWESKKKRAVTAVAKYRKLIRHHEKRIAKLQ